MTGTLPGGKGVNLSLSLHSLILEGGRRSTLIKKWESTNKIVYVAPTDTIPSGFKLQTSWTLLEEEFKPESSKFICTLELWSKTKQLDQPLNEWIAKVHNLVALCDYDAGTQDRIIRDVPFLNCRSQSAKDRIVRMESEEQLQDVIQILQMEEASSLASKNFWILPVIIPPLLPSTMPGMILNRRRKVKSALGVMHHSLEGTWVSARLKMLSVTIAGLRAIWEVLPEEKEEY